LGYSQLEVFGRNMHQLIQGARQDGNPYPFSESPIAKVLATGEGCRIDGEVMWRRDGSALPVEYSSSPIVDNGKIQGAVVAFMDVTERRMLQQQLMQTQKIESIGRLAGGIAHDFNNILTIIVGHASILKRLPPDSPKRPESVVAVEKAAQRGAGLVRQLLTFARKTDVMLESVRLNEVIAEVAKLINETFPKTIIIAMRLESNLPPIHADANQLHQVLVNLCVNARDAMPEGGTLSIGTSQVPLEKVRSKYSAASASEYVEISVTDSGTGMDEQTLNRIFEPFFTTKEVGKGTGLGLAVVFGIVETHKGFIGVESAVGKGTTFHLYFPVQSRTVEERAATEAELVDIPGGSETILVVEDEQMLRELLFGTLTGKGYNVLLAEDGQEMISQYVTHQERISLVISDMGLPKVGGYEAFKKIRSVDPSAKVVLASGYLEPNVKSEILRSGARDFIQKPYSPEEVLKKVREIIDTDAQRS
ncbi:MAG TPA: ATP-binding protein, partial [Bacteroidota bacterium]|nr:ATP-binding protein [Bacteroidota bacterium]